MQQRNNQPPKPLTLREIDLSQYVTHYLNLFWRWKWYILIVAPVVMLGWAFYVTKSGSIRPELEATVVLGMEDPQDLSAVRDVGQPVQSRIEVIRGRSFLKGIVEKLSLQLSIKNCPRSAVFDSVSVDSTASIGNYQFKVDQDNQSYRLLFSNSTLGIRNRILCEGFIYQIESIEVQGLYLHFSNVFLKEPTSIEFNISSLRVAIERLRRSIALQGGISASRGSAIANVIVRGTDYPLITTTANLIAEEFVTRNLNFRKHKTREVMGILQKQLEAATEQLNKAQGAVRAFRQQYPNVNLGSDVANTVNNVTQIESNVYNAQMFAKDAELIRKNLNSLTDIDPNLNTTLNEALAFLSLRNSSSAVALQSELTQLLERQQELRTGFDKNHPYVIENRNKILAIKSKVISLLSDYIDNTIAEVTRQKNQVNGIVQRMQGLPSLQLQLAELERQSQVAEQIHSSILTRYNQVKIADATEVADIFIMDSAVEPIPPPDLVNILMLLGIGIFIGMGLAFGPPIIVDFFDKTVRTESELTKILPYNVLESIPVIKSVDQKSKKTSKKDKPLIRTIDKMLITSEFSPDATNEIFRSLRSKLMLRFHDLPKKKFMVTSYDMSEGKSLITANLAITMAQQKLSTVLIDGDIRRGVQHNSFALSKKVGLSSFLFSDEPVNPEMVKSLLQPTHVQNLLLISSGPNVPNPSELLSSPRFKELIDCLTIFFDVILFDTPPIGFAPDAAIVSDLFSGCVLVVKASSTNVIDLRRKLDEFPNVKSKIVGVVLNEAILDKRLRKYKYSSYYYNIDSFTSSERTKTLRS